MGFVENVKDLYFEWEDKYYAMLDRLNTSVPVYTVIDPLDRVIPSFALFLLLAVVLLLALLLFLASLFPVALKSSFSVTVEDEQGLPINGATVHIAWDGQEQIVQTNDRGETINFTLNRGTQLRAQAEARGFDPSEEQRYTLGDQPQTYRITLIKEKREITYTFSVVGDDGFGLKVPATVHFACTRAPALSPASVTVQPGLPGSVVVDESCGELRATVRAKGYRLLADHALRDGGTIVLEAEEEIPIDPGLLTVEVLFGGAPVTDTPLTIGIFKSFGTADGAVVERKVTTTGQATFTLPPDTYTARVDSTPRFSAGESPPFIMRAGLSKETTINVEERVLGEINVQVVDKANRLPLGEARVTLMKNKSEIEFKVTQRDRNAVVAFSIKDSELYDVVVNHPDYCIQHLENLRFAENTIVAELERYTGQCGGDLLAKVVEVDGPVRNAIVSLYDDEGHHTGFAQRITDDNGRAAFHGVESGVYQVFAHKGAASGWSQIARYTRRDERGQEYLVALNIPPGSVRITVLDEEGAPLQFARVALKDARDGENVEGPYPIESADGTITFTTKADKDVFVTASFEGYGDYVSAAFPVIPNDEQAITLQMEPTIVSGEIEARFLGLFREGFKVNTVAPGRDYTARFRLLVPKPNDYDSIGFHMRTGNEDAFMEHDNVFIKRINAPNASAIARGTAYFPREGFDHDDAFRSADGSKWMTPNWVRFSHGIIEVEATVRVKETARHEENIFLHWRAFARDEDGDMVRDPVDETLGAAPTGQGLYANTHSKWFQVGEETLCEQRWCFSATLLDLDTLLSQAVSTEFAARVGQAYRLTFSVQNNAEYEVFTSPEASIRILNPQENIEFQNYVFITAENRRIEGGRPNTYETDWVTAGTLTPNATVGGTLFFAPRASTAGVLLIEIRSQNIIVFSRELVMLADAAGTLEVRYQDEDNFSTTPPLLASGLARELRVKVLDAETGLEVQDATVKLKNRFGDVLFTTTTSVLGVATLEVPALLPAEQITLVAEKPDYETFQSMLRADERVLEIEPDTIGLAFNAQTQLQNEKTVHLVNRTNFPLRVHAISLEGDFEGLVDEQKARDWLESQYLNMEIDPLDREPVVVRGVLTPRGERVKEPHTLTGVLKVQARAFSQTWEDTARVNASVGLAGNVDDPACMSVKPRAWQTTTKGAQVTTDIQITNGCSVGGAPVELSNVSAQVEWTSSALGDFAIQSGESAIELRPGFFKTFRGKLGKEEVLPARLAFTPNGIASGTVQARIRIRAENPTDAGVQILEDTVEVNIRSVNLEQCISTSKDLITLERQGENQFEITSTEECGGTVEVLVESKLPVTPSTLTLQENESRTVSVFAEDNLAGQYPVYVRVRGPDDTSFEVHQMVRARIEAEGCLLLNRYEYDVFDDTSDPFDGFDRGILTNTCYAQVADTLVKFDERNLVQAMQDALLWAAVGFVYGGVSGLFSGGAATQTQVVGFAALSPEPVDVCAAEGLVTCNTGTCTGNYTEVLHNGRSAVCCTGTCIGTNDTVPEGPAAPTGLQLLGGSGSQLITGVTAALGVTNPIQGAILGFIAGTFYNYSQQEHGEIEGKVLHRDLRVDDFALLLPDAIEDTVANDISVQPQGTQIVPDPGGGALDHEETTLLFVNQTSVTQPDAFNPLFRVLRVDGAHLTPLTEYDFTNKVEFEDFELDTEDEEAAFTKFHLQFNAWRSILAPPAGPITTACKIGERTGQTGPNAVPKVRFAWDWTNITEDTCTDAGEGLYCDATQFSISLLSRIQSAVNLLEASPPTQCPTLEGLLSQRSAELDITDLDYAVTSIQVEKTGTRATVTAVLESNNGSATESDVFFSVRHTDTLITTDCPQGTAGNIPTTVTSREEVSCDFDDLDAGTYTATVELRPQLATCGPGCRNSLTTNDTLSTEFTAGPQTGTFSQCEPFNTRRLPQFIAANPGNAPLKEVQEKLHFTANLIRDGYTADFRHDFHAFATTKTFFDTPATYTGPNGLGQYFNNDERFGFDSPDLRDGAGFLPAGKYDIAVNIEYDNPDWRLFESGQPDATITVEMQRLSTPEPDSPFYHIPFNGLVGQDSPNGRQGYGANFRQESIQSVHINDDLAQLVEAKTIPDSTPVPGTWVLASRVEDFKTLNRDKRGVVLDVKRNTGLGDVELVFSPSTPTPVVLDIDGGQAEKAYAVYNLALDGAPQQPGSALTRWDGMAPRCRDFEDRDVAEAFVERADLHAGVGQFQCAGTFGTENYGLEWCNLRRNGTVFLRSIFFTPEDQSARLKIVDAQDQAIFHTPTDQGLDVELQGSAAAALLNIQDVLEAVEAGDVCVTGVNNPLRSQFFWNPEPVYAGVQTVLDDVPNQCIESFQS